MADLFRDDAPPEIVSRYLTLTRETLPRMARTPEAHWPVREDHCFQRIVLDTICGDVWYDHIPHPAYKHLSPDQAQAAVELCLDILHGRADLAALNRQSLRWRGKAR